MGIKTIAGKTNVYSFNVTPDGDEPVSFRLLARQTCASGGICSSDGTMTLDAVPVDARTVLGPVLLWPSAQIRGQGYYGYTRWLENSGTVNFFVYTSRPITTSGTATVTVSSSDGAATLTEEIFGEELTLTPAAASSEYESFASILLFEAGVQANSFSIDLNPDSDSIDNEYFYIELSITVPEGMNVKLWPGREQFIGIVAESDCPTCQTAIIPDPTPTPTPTPPILESNSPDPQSQLTATFSDIPSSHDGTEFQFSLTFSDNPELSYSTLKYEAISATNATVKQTYRKVQGSNQGWNIVLVPTGTDDIVMTLIPAFDCDSANSICTSDGRALNGASAVVIPGPD